jgi:hypothetical protein
MVTVCNHFLSHIDKEKEPKNSHLKNHRSLILAFSTGLMNLESAQRVGESKTGVPLFLRLDKVIDSVSLSSMTAHKDAVVNLLMASPSKCILMQIIGDNSKLVIFKREPSAASGTQNVKIFTDCLKSWSFYVEAASSKDPMPGKPEAMYHALYGNDDFTLDRLFEKAALVKLYVTSPKNPNFLPLPIKSAEEIEAIITSVQFTEQDKKVALYTPNATLRALTDNTSVVTEHQS